MKTPLLTTLLAGSLAFATVGCDVDQTQPGEMPDVDVDMEPGTMPEFDVETADVDVSMEKQPVDVPTDIDIETEEQMIETPDVDIDLPDED
ncbi:hypothetical protein [Crateriforma conspicua]|uniref:Secreted protein n=1 Tax=Crateriforma conspicua TaxID=2527996 RepID=A0A5C5XZS8_9PLAN|nr:hypothetical protein [Crateriforma conspicua]QDV63540.1 hypothetical protein Mal65_26840 [Crateriforma conspicua]TWT68956.1 hypothetical protein Pan14r_12400 [Crateriforma conspicua]